MKTLLFLFLIGCVASIGWAEPLSVAGQIVPNAASGVPYALLSARDGRKVAALTDPRGLVIVNQWVILQTETTDTTVQGLPVLEVVDVLQEHWEQPSNWRHFAKGFGAWSGFGNTIRAENFAAVPFEDRRAYYDDNGILSTPLFGIGSGPVHPPVVLLSTVDRQGLRLTWNVQAGANYDVLGSREVTAGYTVVSNLTSGANGSASIVVPTDGPHKFFKIQY